MSDFLRRLAHRSVLPAVRDAGPAPLEPRLPTRYESFATRPTERDDLAWDLVEDDIDVVAPKPPSGQLRPTRDEAPTATEPSQPAWTQKPARDQPNHPPESVWRHDPGESHGVSAPSVVRPSPTAVADVDPPGRVTAPIPAPLLTIDAAAQTSLASQEPVDAHSSLPKPQQPVSLAQLDPVVEIHHVPGPVIVTEAGPVEGPSQSAPVHRRREPAQPQRGDRLPQRIVFAPREPLAPLGLEPLREREVLSVPAVANVAEPDSVVHVHIDRLEVNRPAPAAPPPRPARPSSILSLDDYLAQRTAGGWDRGHRR